ncbi:NrdH-like glutaredoxin [Microbacterium phage Necrophoxinus]|nr:NrdH-like glutaredoxin [Microbacterium phage Lyell]QWS69400.1 NrdH-like glutaredoxin [Microbacterium phage Necrophoxinus]WMI33906.1 NrdH-like glutaredoxin [Microbacterium phage Erenyeager]WNO25926.1 NrdH-like glutaredoxin [Microbacterium phage ASegato]
MKITVYKTPTCATCTMAAKRLIAAGADVELVDLTEHPDVLLEIKVKLGVAPDAPIQVPKFLFETGEIGDITDLPALLARASDVA